MVPIWRKFHLKPFWSENKHPFQSFNGVHSEVSNTCSFHWLCMSWLFNTIKNQSRVFQWTGQQCNRHMPRQGWCTGQETEAQAMKNPVNSHYTAADCFFWEILHLHHWITGRKSENSLICSAAGCSATAPCVCRPLVGTNLCIYMCSLTCMVWKAVPWNQCWDTLAHESRAQPHLREAVASAGLFRNGEEGSSPAVLCTYLETYLIPCRECSAYSAALQCV